MKRILITALCAVGLLSAGAEQSAYWKYDGNTSMTDGEWTFTVQMRYDMIDGSIYPIWVKGCTGYPATPTTLDFSKDVVYEPDRNYKFAITQIQPGFNGSTAGQSIKVLKLPTHGYPFNIGDKSTTTEGFKNCHNLESVVPFLPDSCIAIGAEIFSGCEKLASPLIWRGGSAMLKPSDPEWESSYASLWGLFEGTAIPSVDLSESDIEAIHRRAFENCASLKSVKLPRALTLLASNPFAKCKALELVEFNSVPSSLSGFEGCSALKEVRFNHAAPSGPNAIDILIYNAISTEYQHITTYLVLDSDESDKLEIWKNYATGNVINSSDSTWSATYAGDANLSKRRPLLLYSAQEELAVSVASPVATANSIGFNVVVGNLGEFASLDLLVQVSKNSDFSNPVYDTTVETGITSVPVSVPVEVTGLDSLTQYYIRVQPTADGAAQDWIGADPITTLEEVRLCTLSIAKGEDAESGSGKLGTFVISRASGDSLAAAITVNYTVDASSTAEAGVHYVALSGQATIPAGQRSGVIEVTALGFGYIGAKSLTVKLAAGDYEIAAGSDTATISVATETLSSVLISKGEDANEGTGKVGWFVVSRGAGEPTALPIKVTLSFGGTAVAGQTYRTIKPEVTIPAGERSVKVFVIPHDDQSITSDATVEATITACDSGSGSGSAVLTIVNGATYGGWKLYNDYMTDGTWKFTVSLRGSTFADDPATYELWLQDCTQYPTTVSTVDFAKAIQNVSQNRSSSVFAISDLSPGFANTVNGALKEAGKYVGAVVLPDDGHKYVIADSAFNSLPNLTSVTPFLPKSCKSLGQYTFKGYKGSKELVFYGEEVCRSPSSNAVFDGCAITNADLSASTVTALRRDCFANCPELKEVKLSPTIQEFGVPGGNDTANRTPFEGSGGESGVKLVFTGDRLPLMTCNDCYVSAIEFAAPLAQLQDDAFASYYRPGFGTRLKTIIFDGPPPATIGANIFSGGYLNDTITVYVPNYNRAEWRVVADKNKLTKEEGGTWTSGGRQRLVLYGDPRLSFGIYVH